MGGFSHRCAGDVEEAILQTAAYHAAVGCSRTRSCTARGLAVTVVRPANVYGVGSLPWIDVVVAALRARVPLLVDGGTGNAGLVHVANLADALVLAAADDGAIGGTFNVCDESDVTWRRYFGDIAAMIGVELQPPVSYGALWDAARQDEQPEHFVTPPAYRSIPLATLALIGADNRYPAARIRRLGWAPAVGYAEAMADIARARRDDLRTASASSHRICGSPPARTPVAAPLAACSRTSGALMRTGVGETSNQRNRLARCNGGGGRLSGTKSTV